MDKTEAESIARQFVDTYHGHEIPNSSARTLMSLAKSGGTKTESGRATHTEWYPLEREGLVLRTDTAKRRKYKITPKGRAVAKCLETIEANTRKRLAAERRG
jgi:hypothetical protein